MHIPHLEQAYENIKKTCDSKLKQIYPIQIPELVNARYQKELEYLKTSDYLDDFEIYRCLNMEATKCLQVLLMRGTTTSSYIIYLLGNSLLNPLPTHYYCPKCGHYETVDTKLFGIDLPADKCPTCQTNLIADGFNLPLEVAWGLDGKKTLSFDYNISEEFLPFAKRVLQNLYPRHVIAPLGLCNRPRASQAIEMKHSGFLILPEGRNIEDYPEMTGFLEDGELCLSGNILDIENNYIHRILLLQNRCLEQMIAMQRKTGIYANEITLHELHTLNWNDINNSSALTDAESYLFHTIKPKTFYDMVCLNSASHNTYSNKECSPHEGNYYSLPTIFEKSNFKKYPCYTREDFFDELLKMGIDLEKAYEIAEFIRKGKQNSAKQKFADQFASFELPEEFKSVAKEYLYLFPRSHCAEYMLMYAKLAFYAKKDSRAFSKIAFKR
ncbi:MAG: hypothetical protein K2N51_02895 [Lachnospiraceae bacterium]|nr:hypothetical protein [Lachnospiraceae bacterium]